MTTRSPTEFAISAGAYIYASLLLLLLPLKLIVSAFLAAAIHEYCHILLLHFYHVPILRIRIGIAGAVIQTAPVSPNQELVCAAAGPIGSFLCLLFIRYFPLFALCGCIQGLFNLLPILPLDGGRILRCFCLCCCPKYTAVVCQAARLGTVAFVLFLCIVLTRRTADGFYLLPAAYFLLRTVRIRKIPCKERHY